MSRLDELFTNNRNSWLAPVMKKTKCHHLYYILRIALHYYVPQEFKLGDVFSRIMNQTGRSVSSDPLRSDRLAVAGRPAVRGGPECAAASPTRGRRPGSVPSHSELIESSSGPRSDAIRP